MHPILFGGVMFNKKHSEKSKRKMSISHKGKHIGNKNNSWKGGKYKDSHGYILVWVNPKSPFTKMTTKRKFKNYVYAHRLVMAKHLGRCLESWEIVHHINGIKSDNRIENLLLMTRPQHRELINYLAELWVKEHQDIAKKISSNWVKKINSKSVL